jgi:hypothetical protein
MDAAPRPPLLKRVPPGGWMAISWYRLHAETLRTQAEAAAVTAERLRIAPVAAAA